VTVVPGAGLSVVPLSAECSRRRRACGPCGAATRARQSSSIRSAAPQAHRPSRAAEPPTPANGTTDSEELFLPSASPPLALALRGALPKGPLDSLGLVETHSVGSALLAADAALKAAEVRLVKLELARGIGGKGYFAVSGSLDMVEAAVLAGAAAITPELLVGTEMIPAPHGDFVRRWG
jgi:hypothetical protein